jgi:hypothetical protein
MKAEEIPQGLHATQYGHKLLENIGLPPITSNVKLMGDCIAAVAKSQKIRPDEAYVWLFKRCKIAQENGEKVNYLWFSNGEYNQVRMINSERYQSKPDPRWALELAERESKRFSKMIEGLTDRRMP